MVAWLRPISPARLSCRAQPTVPLVFNLLLRKSGRGPAGGEIVCPPLTAQRRARRLAPGRLALSTTQKGNASITEYFTKMRSLGDEMAATGKPLDDEEMMAYILNGLDTDYEPIVSALIASWYMHAPH